MNEYILNIFLLKYTLNNFLLSYSNDYHHHHVMLLAWISRILSCHSSLSSIASGRPRLHPESVQSCCRKVLVGQPTLVRPCEGVHRITSLMSSFLLLQLCPACLVCLICMVLEMGGRWPYSCPFVGCCFKNLFSIPHSILVQFLFSIFFIRLVSIHIVHLYSRMDMSAAWKKLHFILSDNSDFPMIDNLSIAVHTFTSHILMSFSVDEMLLPRYVNLSTNFREPLFNMEISPF